AVYAQPIAAIAMTTANTITVAITYGESIVTIAQAPLRTVAAIVGITRTGIGLLIVAVGKLPTGFSTIIIGSQLKSQCMCIADATWRCRCSGRLEVVHIHQLTAIKTGDIIKPQANFNSAASGRSVVKT